MRILAALWLGVVLLAPCAAEAQDFEAARTAFSEAQSSFQASHFKMAAIYFQRAYDIVKDPVVLYNVGEAWEKAGEGKKAVAAYHAYLVAQPAASDHAEVMRRVQQIIAQNYVLPKRSAPGDDPSRVLPAVQTPPPKPAPPPAPVVAPPAPPPAPPPVEMPSPVVAPSSNATTPAPSHGRPLWIGAWVTFGVAVAALGAGVGLAVSAKSQADSIADQQSFVGPNGQPHVYDAMQQQAYQQAHDDGQRFQNAAIGCFAGAGAMAIVSTALFIVDSRRDRPARAMQVVPSVGKGTAALSLHWSF